MALKSELRAGSNQSGDISQGSTGDGQPLQQRIDELEARAAQQAGHIETLDAERNSLLSISTALQEEVEQLRQTLSERAAIARDGVENILIEAPESSLASGSEDGSEKVRLERDVLKKHLESRAEIEAELRKSLSEVRTQLDEQQSIAADELASVAKTLEAERQKLAVLQAESAARDSQLESSRVESSQKDVDIDVLRDELEVARQRIIDLQQLAEQGDERARVLDQEYQDYSRRSHDDLKRKNDIEKEMQGQIDRLRKQLEQTSRDYQKSRVSAQEDLDNLRDELHAERQARAEERAQMAARQRELKEQLAAVATEHEVNFTKQTDVIEEAVDAVRLEERDRLQGVLDAHAATEEQLVKMQQELQQARAEMVTLRHQDRERHQADIKLMEEQYRQAESTIKQLQSQLRELTRERDSALDEQNILHDKISSLRGEVEVARGLINVAGPGQLEDATRLRKQLDETRKNVEIAVRLRAEAEAARDRLLEERNALQAHLSGGGDAGETLHIPSLDVRGGRKSGEGQRSRREHEIDKPVGRLPAATKETPVSVSSSRDRRAPGWLGGAAGVLIAGVIGAAGWWFMGGKSSGSGDIASQSIVESRAPEAGDVSVSASGLQVDQGAAAPQFETPAITPAPVVQDGGRLTNAQQAVSDEAVHESQARMLDAEFTAPVSPEVKEPSPVAGAIGSMQKDPDVRASKDADSQSSARPVRQAVLRTFADPLKSGGEGPVMVELAVAGYFMGSYGNSLNYEEGPRHLVKLPGFSMGKYEVTFNDYDRFARATGRRLPYDETWGRGERPVINVTWNDARAYADWLSQQTGHRYRLPSEAEWEYAARGGSYWLYWWMAAEDDVVTDGVWANCHNCGSEWDGVQTASVGQFPANPYGLYDMTGNVQEWVNDCYHESYDGAPQDGSAWLRSHCTQRVVRGGGYTSPLDTLRSAKRGQLNQETRLDNLGFRVVREN